MGRELGYPECCIKEFCDLPPELMTGNPPRKVKQCFRAAHIEGKYTGFIPCNIHAKQILNGEIQLTDLIKDRVIYPDFPEA